MQRGRHVAARAANLDKIARLKASKRLKVVCLPGHELWSNSVRVSVFYLDDQQIYVHKGLTEGSEWPPEDLMALLGLTIQVLDIELPPPAPTHPVSASGKEYNRLLQAQNAQRWKEPDGR